MGRGLLAALLLLAARPAIAQDAFADAVAALAPGTNGGFGAGLLPDIVLGPPRGGGATQGSFDIVALGSGGSIVLRFDLPVICDGPGPDFTVFENAFHQGTASGPIFAEYGFVAVSQDGINFVDVPYDAITHAGLAGQQPVLSHPDNGIDPLDPAVSGGDSFDLAAIGLSWASYVRITDVAGVVPDTGDLPQFSIAPNAGFDLDAIAALHACDPGAQPSATPTTALPASATPTASPSPTPPQATATATVPASSHDAAVLGRAPLRVRMRAGQPTVTKRLRIKVRNADAAGHLPIHLSADGCGAIVAASVDFERRAAGAQDVATVRAGRMRAAVVSVTLAADGVTTPDKHTPSLCALTLAADADVAGNADPTPANNTTTVELRLLDLNDVQ